MPPVSITEFRAQVLKEGGLAKANRYDVVISPDNPFLLGQLQYLRGVPLLCDAAEIPGTAFEATEIQYYGPSYKVPIRRTFQNATLSFLTRESMDTRHFFEGWHKYIDGGFGDYDFKFIKEYATKIIVTQYNELETRLGVLRCTMVEAYPISVQSMALNWQGETIHKTVVQFDYRHAIQEEMRHGIVVTEPPRDVHATTEPATPPSSVEAHH